MRKVIISYRTLKPADLHQKCADVITGMTGNATFPALPTSIANMTTMNAALQTAMNAAATKDRVKQAALRTAKKNVVAMLRGIGMYVNTVVTDGDEEKLLSSGLDLTKVPEPKGPPQVVVNLKAIFTNVPGKIKLRWDRSQYAEVYHVYRSSDGGATWVLLKEVFTTSFMDENLASDTRYQYKVIAINSEDEAPASDVASQLAA